MKRENKIESIVNDLDIMMVTRGCNNIGFCLSCQSTIVYLDYMCFINRFWA